MENEQNKLTVLEAYTRDVGRGVARINSDVLKERGLSLGDVIEVKGKRKTVAKCLSSLTAEQTCAEEIQLAQARAKLHQTKIQENIQTVSTWPEGGSEYIMNPVPGRSIRIDGLTRNNASVAIGEYVSIKKITAPPAEKITVIPLESIPPIDERYLADALESIPVLKGDNVMVPYFGGRLTFNVVDIIPDSEAVLVTNKTIFVILNKGPTLKEVDGFRYHQDGKTISLVLDDAIKKEASGNYVVLKIHLQYGGFGVMGEFHVKLEKDDAIQTVISKYKNHAQSIAIDANNKLAGTENVNSAELINKIKFEILEGWRNLE